MSVNSVIIPLYIAVVVLLLVFTVNLNIGYRRSKRNGTVSKESIEKEREYMNIW